MGLSFEQVEKRLSELKGALRASSEPVANFGSLLASYQSLLANSNPEEKDKYSNLAAEGARINQAYQKNMTTAQEIFSAVSNYLEEKKSKDAKELCEIELLCLILPHVTTVEFIDSPYARSVAQ